MKIVVVPMLVAASCAAVAMAIPNRAEACGGTFCDGGPAPMPVDQRGENILFVRSGGEIQAHIQIQYMGEPQKFGWVIPMNAVPEFSVGSEPLFQALLAGTVPTYWFNQQFDDCSFGDDGNADGGAAPDAGGTSGAGEDGGLDDGGEGPEILLQETVGAYDITVLTGGSAAEVIEWLDANGYQQDPEAEPILQEYLDEGLVFGAVKLTGGTDTDEIHPIVLTFPGDEACIPLRLTRIAAVEDMAVRSFFLGQNRTVPRTYRHVLVNPLKIDWINSADNYNEVISLAVDHPMASGRAFVTEYAGPSNVVGTAGVYDPIWDASAFEAIEPVNVPATLMSQGLFFCDVDFQLMCGSNHPLVQPLLDEFLPVPDGVDPLEFYTNTANYEGLIDMTVWDAALFQAALQARIIEPGQNAVQILQDNPYLTRMYTLISPAEMMEDPWFHENAELPEVTNQQTGTRRFLCNGDSVFTLPDGRQVYLPAGTTDWPSFEDEPAWAQPWEEIVEDTPANGAPMHLVNNTEAIDVALDAYNAAHGWPGGGGGADGGSADDGGSGTGGADDGGSAGTDGGGGADGGDQAEEAGGCGCRSDGSPTGAMWALFALGAGAVVRRRRR